MKELKQINNIPFEKHLNDLIVDLYNDSRYRSIRYIGLISSYFNLHETDKIRTAGVMVTNRGIKLAYNPKFIASLTNDEVKFLILHEVHHIILKHQEREGTRNHKVANVAMDMVLNGIIKSDIVNTLNYSKVISSALFIPSDYKGIITFEHVYDFLMKDKKENENKQTLDEHFENSEGDSKEDSEGGQEGEGQEGDDSKEGQGEGNEEEGNGKPSKGSGSDNAKETLEKIFGVNKEEGERILNKEEADFLKDKIMNDVASKLAGDEAGNFSRLLDQIRPNKEVDIMKIIDRMISTMKGMGHINRTYKKINRVLPNQLKGKRRLMYRFNAIVDTSGSMDEDRFNKVMGLLIKRGIEINLIMADTKVQDHVLITDKSQIEKNFKRSGYGGTDMQPAIDYILVDKDMRNLPIVLLTDGYAPSISIPQKVASKSVVITTDVEIPVNNKIRLRQIILKKK